MQKDGCKELLAEDELDALRRMMTPGRIERIERVLAGRTRTLCVALERIDKSHNLSAVLRTCDAMGVQNVHIVAPPPLEIRRGTTQGAHKWLTIARHDDTAAAFRAMHAQGYRVAAAVLWPDAVDVSELDPLEKTALLFGNEKDGLTREAAERADIRFRLPMHGFVQSLNLSVACAMTLSMLVRERVRLRGASGDLAPGDLAALRGEWYRKSVRLSDEVLNRIAEDDDTEEILELR